MNPFVKRHLPGIEVRNVGDAVNMMKIETKGTKPYFEEDMKSNQKLNGEETY